MKKNTSQRLLVFFIGVPAFVAVVLYASFARNIALVALVAFIQYASVREASGLFSARGIKVRPMFLSLAAIGSSAAAYVSSFARPLGLGGFLEVQYAYALAVTTLLLGSYAFSRKSSFGSILSSLSAELFIFVYCGLFASFFVFITSGFQYAKQAIFTFTLMTFGNDSLAWLAGVTLGRRRELVDVSPGKSLAGFIGGFLGSLAAGALSFVLFRSAGAPSLPAALALGTFMGVGVITGDLVESALKRSAGVKDSSALVPGRGGILDSFDSLIFTAPLFVVASLLLGLFSHGA